MTTLTKITERLERRTALLTKKREEAREAQTRLDETVLEARDNGMRYRAIAAKCGKSVAWVQAALARAGYRAGGG